MSEEKIDKNNIGFKCYEYNGHRIVPNDHATDSLIYTLNSQKMFFSEWDARRMVKPPTKIQKLKRYLSHVWYALKGGECE